MAIADANRASIRVIEETTWGTTPVAGITRDVRLTSSSLSASKETVMSDELRADRMVSNIVEVSAMSEGDINFEFSTGATDEFLAAFVMGAWSRPMTRDFWRGKSVSVTGASEVTVAGRDITGYLTVGRRIKIDGFVNPANNGYRTISAVVFAAGNTTITLTETGLVVEAGSVNARVFDANDAILINNTAITASAAGFSGNGSNPFAAAFAAGQLVTGQKIAVSGLGRETGTITVSGAVTASTITVSDGINSAAVVSGTDFTDAATLATAINKLRFASIRVNVKATVAGGVVTVTNLNKVGGAITETVDDANITVATFTGGTAGASGVFTILSVTDDLIVTSPAPTDAAAGSVTVKASMLRNPGDYAAIAQRSFSIETGYNDIGQFMIQDGMVPGTFSLELSTGAIVTGTIGFQGRSTGLRQSTVLGSGAYTVLEAPQGEVVNATTNVGNVYKDGDDFGACIQSLSISGEANLRQQACVGQKFSRGIGAGRFNLTGSMSVFFQDEDLFQDFINHETVALAFSINDLEGAAYYWTIPATKLSTDGISPSGIDQDVVESIEWQAFRDAETACMVQIDRFSPTGEV